MIPRRIEPYVQDRLAHMPAVALLGPRQVGKTTLAQELSRRAGSPFTWIWNRRIDREKLADTVPTYR